MYTCPCCGSSTFANPPGSLDVCQVCQWQDDASQLLHPFAPAGANPRSLAEAQVWFVQYGAPLAGVARDAHWFPLWQQKTELPEPGSAPDTGSEYDLYYWLRTPRDKVPAQPLGLRRVRNRIMEYLELASSFTAQKAYPAASVADEVVNQWEDWVTPDWKQQFTEPVFSEEERKGIAQFARVWDVVANGLPYPLPPLDALFTTPQWQSLQRAAAELLVVFQLRGRSDEN